MDRTENSQHFQISGKYDNLQELTKIFETLFSKITVPFDLVPDKSDRELRIFCRVRNISVGRDFFAMQSGIFL